MPSEGVALVVVNLNIFASLCECDALHRDGSLRGSGATNSQLSNTERSSIACCSAPKHRTDSWEHRYFFTFIATRISACAGTEHHEFALFHWLSICL
jgi:hypothetical protein